MYSTSHLMYRVFNSGIIESAQGSRKFRKIVRIKIHKRKYSQEFINRLISAVSVKEVLEDICHTNVIINTKRNNHRVICPFCEGSKTSAKYNSYKNVFKCFACSASAGTCISLVQKYFGSDFSDSVRILLRKYPFVKEIAQPRADVDENLPF